MYVGAQSALQILTQGSEIADMGPNVILHFSEATILFFRI